MEENIYEAVYKQTLRELYAVKCENKRLGYLNEDLENLYYIQSRINKGASYNIKKYKEEIERLKQRINEQSNTINVYADEIKTLRAQVQQLEGVVPFWRKWFL